MGTAGLPPAKNFIPLQPVHDYDTPAIPSPQLCNNEQFLEVSAPDTRWAVLVQPGIELETRLQKSAPQAVPEDLPEVPRAADVVPAFLVAKLVLACAFLGHCGVRGARVAFGGAGPLFFSCPWCAASPLLIPSHLRT